jgi:DNA topoisomerase-1
MGYTLIVAEKPNAAGRIASALADGDVHKESRSGAVYYKIKRAGREIVVVPAVGHLFVLQAVKGKWDYPVFDLEWKPTYQNKNNAWAKKYFSNIESLAGGASEFIAACDYDIEGSTIAYNILKLICGVEDGRRMKFSTLMQSDIVEAYETASHHLDFPQIEAGLTRHNLDFLWGINTSRALTIALRDAGGYKTLSTGRVQGPTLNILEKRQAEIEAFVPKPFWQIELHGLLNSEKIIALHVEDKFWDHEKAQRVYDKCKGKPAKVSEVERSEYKQPPPPPFDLTTLQRDSYNTFGYSPKQTLDIAQSLYEAALISYPRTSSQKLPPKIGYKSIITQLSEQPHYAESCALLLKKDKLWPRQGAKEDPAHPAIYPTGNKPKAITDHQKKVYDMITKRFLAAFADAAIRETMKITIKIDDERFVSTGVRTIEPGWIKFYEPYAKFKEQILPHAKASDPVEVSKLELLKKETQPPKRFTQASILKEMETLGLGTKATRAQILETLYDRGYIKEKTILVTKLGQSVTLSLEKYCPEIVSLELTKKFEQEMEDIQAGSRKRVDVVNEARETLKKILDEFRANEKNIGLGILGALKESIQQENIVGKCDKCGSDLRIIYSKATHKRFVGCSGYPKCSNGFPLPQLGSVNVLSAKCKTCGLSTISVKSKGKRPWKMCVRCGFANKKKEEKD